MDDNNSDSHSMDDTINSTTKRPLQIHLHTDPSSKQAIPSPPPFTTSHDRAGGQVTRDDLNAAIEAGD